MRDGSPRTPTARDGATVRPRAPLPVAVQARRHVGADVDARAIVFAREAARSAPLVWRQGAAPSEGRSEPTYAPGCATASPRNVDPSRPAPAAAEWTPRPSPDRATAPKLDASAIDRLADVVLQRLQRSMRIERERRGI